MVERCLTRVVRITTEVETITNPLTEDSYEPPTRVDPPENSYVDCHDESLTGANGSPNSASRYGTCQSLRPKLIQQLRFGLPVALNGSVNRHRKRHRNLMARSAQSIC